MNAFPIVLTINYTLYQAYGLFAIASQTIVSFVDSFPQILGEPRYPYVISNVLISLVSPDPN